MSLVVFIPGQDAGHMAVETRGLDIQAQYGIQDQVITYPGRSALPADPNEHRTSTICGILNLLRN